MVGQKKGFKHTEETKKKIGEYSKKNWNNLDYILKIKATKKKRREELGYVNSPETRKKLSDIMKEKIESGEFNPISISPYIKGHKIGMLGKKQSEYQKKTVGEKLKETRKTQIFPSKDTSIELKIQSFLTQLHIEFFTHKYISEINNAYQCDIFIPKQIGINQKTIIECDGDYWHGNINQYSIEKLSKRIKEQIQLDKERTAQLKEAGYKVIRLWEHEIKIMELDSFKEVILQCGLIV